MLHGFACEVLLPLARVQICSLSLRGPTFSISGKSRQKRRLTPTVLRIPSARKAYGENSDIFSLACCECYDHRLCDARTQRRFSLSRSHFSKTELRFICVGKASFESDRTLHFVDRRRERPSGYDVRSIQGTGSFHRNNTTRAVISCKYLRHGTRKEVLKPWFQMALLGTFVAIDKSTSRANPRNNLCAKK